jgi:hypothetical protein
MNASLSILPRESRHYIEPSALRALLKTNLGLNARKVTVSTRSSIQYLTITIRDASVDVQAVKALAASLYTWSMAVDDYVSGQSVTVEITESVKAALAAPFIEEIKRVAPTVARQSGESLSTGAILWLGDQGFHIERCDGGKRGTYVWEHDVLAGTEWAVAKLAFDASQI